MGAFHGRNGAVYIQGSGSAAIAIAQRTDWTLDLDYELTPANAMGDTWTKQLQGLRKGKGTFKANLDNSTTNLFDAYDQGSPRNCYIYPDAGTAANYFYGTLWPKFGTDGTLTKVAGATVAFDTDGQWALNGTLG